MPLDWYDVLLALEYAPDNRLRMGELVEHVVLSPSGLTRLIDRIEKAGLVERRLCPNDRRSFEVELTQAGRAERERSWPIHARAVAQGFRRPLQRRRSRATRRIIEAPGARIKDLRRIVRRLEARFIESVSVAFAC